MKCLEKDRTRRYESAAALAQDIQRYLADEPVLACPPSLGYRLAKWSRKHRGVLTLAAATLLILLLATGFSIRYAIQANDARELANREKAKAVGAQRDAEENFSAALDAIDKLLANASNPELAEAPRLQPLRRQMLEEVLAFYDQFRLKQGDSDTLRLRAAETKRSLSQLANDLGDLPRAVAIMDSALAIVQELSDKSPRNAEYASLYMVITMDLGWLHLHGKNDFSQSEKYFSLAAQKAKPLLGLEPPASAWVNTQAENTLVYAQLGLASVARARGEEQRFREMILALYEAVPDSQALELSRSRELELLVATAYEKTDGEKAETHYRRMVDFSRKLLDEELTRHTKIWHAHNLLTAAEFLLERDPGTAQQWIEESLTWSDQLVNDFPGFALYSEVLAHGIKLKLDSVPLGQEQKPALEILDDYVDRFPQLDVVHRLRAEWLQNEPSAEERLSEAIATYPEQYAYFRYRGDLLLKQEKHQEARADYRAAIERIPVQGDKNNLWRRGILLTLVGDLEQARVDFQQIITDSMGPKYLAYELTQASREFAAQGLCTSAITLAEEGGRICPPSFSPDVALCEAKLKLERFDELLKHANDALDKAPGEWWILKRRAEAHMGLGAHDQVLADLGRALELEPSDLSTIWWIRPEAIVASQDATFQAGMLQLMDRGVELSHRSSDMLLRRARLNSKLGHATPTRRDLEELLTRSNRVDELYPLALLALETKDQTLYQRVCRLMPDFAETEDSPQSDFFAAWTCAVAAEALEDYSVVMRLAHRAVESDPSNQSFVTALGAVQLRAGQGELARETLARGPR